MTAQEMALEILSRIEHAQRESEHETETYATDRMSALIDDIETLCKEQVPFLIEIDHVNGCMKALGVSLNLLDPDGTLSSGKPGDDWPVIMQAVRKDYRALSNAIHMLCVEE